MIVARILGWYGAHGPWAGATIAAPGGRRLRRDLAVELGDPIRVIEVSPADEPVPTFAPEPEPVEEPEEVPA